MDERYERVLARMDLRIGELESEVRSLRERVSFIEMIRNWFNK